MAESEEERHLKLTGEFDCDPDAAAHAAPLHLARDGPGGEAAVPRGASVAIGPAIEDGFYYDFAEGRRRSRRRTSSGSRTVMREIAQGRPAVRAAGDAARRGDRVLPRSAASPSRSRSSQGIDAPTGLALPAGRLHRPLPRARTWRRTGAAQGLQAALVARAPTGAATRRTRCCSGSTAPPGSRQEELDKHLWRLEEAKKRDHRKLGRELDLFDFYDVAPGAPFWLPNGMVIWSASSRSSAREVARRAAATWRSRRRSS